MTYQQFDETLQNVFAITPKREQKLRARWRRISRRGPAFFMLAKSFRLAAWMLLCLALFASFFHTRSAVMANASPIVFSFTMMLLFCLPAHLVNYRTTEKFVASLDRRDARLQAKWR